MLKSLELLGFKSFADRTIFEFSRGVTCVVGPNGSGKSNVVDAIKWILGDQSPKSLRGKEMADVIFNGSASRRPSGYAEATLSFDNSSGLLPIETREVRIGRRLYRSGDSEYLLNGNAVRLKDVRDLMMGTGAGTAAYSIIEQGRVDQLLQASPLTRRVVFEEAAGISRYKAKRVEAERRLERVDQNLQRLTDIVDELDAQLTSTRSQATKAAKYRELSQELKQLWTGLAADTYRYLSNKHEAARQAADELQRRHQDLTSLCEQLIVERKAIDEQSHAAEDQQRTLERRQSVHRQEIVSANSTLQHQRSRVDELSERIHQLRATRLMFMRQSAIVTRELAETRSRLLESEAACQAKRQSIARRRDQLAQLRSQMEAARRDQADLNRQRGEQEQSLAEIESHRTRLEHEIDSLRQSHAAALERLRQFERIWLDTTDVLHAATERLAQAEGQFHAAAERVDQLQARRHSLSAARSSNEDILSQLREQRSAVQARHAVLQDLSQRSHALAGLKQVQELARQGEHPWDLVVGCVHELLEVTLEHAPIIEAALLGRSNLIVVQHLEPFLRLIESGELRLHERLGFIELGSHVLTVDLTGDNAGVIDRCDRLVFEDPRSPGLAAQVLGNVWLVESLPIARRLRSEGQRSIRLVTLQGELLEPDGTLHVGESPIEIASVGARAELRELRNRLARIDRDIVDGENHADSLATALDELNAELASEQTVLAALGDDLATERTRHSLQQQDHQRTQLAVDEQRNAADSIQIRMEQHEERHQQAVERHQAAVESLMLLQLQLEDLSRHVSETDAAIYRLNGEINSQEMELAKFEERLGALATNQTRLEGDQSQQQTRMADVLRQLADIQVQRGRSSREILASQATAAEHQLEVERLIRDVAATESQRREIREQRNEISVREERLQRERRQVGDRLQSETLRVRDYESQIANLAERIHEEYQLTLDALLAQGCSALHHVPRGGSDDDDASEAAAGTPSAGDDAELEWVDEPLDPADAAQLFEHRRAELDDQVQRLRRRIKLMGHVNTEALEGLEELETRHSTLAAQLEDLQEAKRALEDIIRRINVESQRLFIETFESIRGHFRELFRKLFGGGEADIILEDPNDILECGIDIVARPPGKELRSISLLSGGEKTLTAVGMLFAMFKSKPSPYCVLDEVDAALDDANVERYASLVKEFRAMTQFVIITHRKRTMTAADVLYGVTMEQAGVSKRMSVKFEDVSENGDFKKKAA